MTTVYMYSPASGDLFTLDTVTSVNKTASNTVTKSSVMEGAAIGDGFTKGNPQVSFTGLCSYNKIVRNPVEDELIPDPIAFSLILDEIIDSYERFTLYGNDLIPDLHEVVIVDYSITQNQFIDTMEVSMTVEQVFVSERAIRTRITQPEKTKGSDLDVTEKSEEGKGTKTQVDQQDNLLNTGKEILVQSARDISDAVSGVD